MENIIKTAAIAVCSFVAGIVFVCGISVFITPTYEYRVRDTQSNTIAYIKSNDYYLKEDSIWTNTETMSIDNNCKFAMKYVVEFNLTKP
jgi:hypothetical protein